MKENTPLKRSKELVPFSKDHHHALLLGWKIRTGLRKAIDIDRIAAYTFWFFENHLAPHFELEENFMFPVLGNDNELVKQALSEHIKIRELIKQPIDAVVLADIADTLEMHIRFEERFVFQEIQSVASRDQLQTIASIHHGNVFIENEDQFWK